MNAQVIVSLRDRGDLSLSGATHCALFRSGQPVLLTQTSVSSVPGLPGLLSSRTKTRVDIINIVRIS